MDELTQNLLKNGVFSPFEEAMIRNLAQINENLEEIKHNLFWIDEKLGKM